MYTYDLEGCYNRSIKRMTHAKVYEILVRVSHLAIPLVTYTKLP